MVRLKELLILLIITLILITALYFLGYRISTVEIGNICILHYCFNITIVLVSAPPQQQSPMTSIPTPEASTYTPNPLAETTITPELPTSTPPIPTATNVTTDLSTPTPSIPAIIVQQQLQVGEELYSVALTESLLAAGGKDGSVYLLRLRDGELRKEEEMFHSSVNSLAFSPDETMLAVGLESGTTFLWRDREWILLSEWSAPVRSLAFSPDSRLLAIGYLDGTVYIYRTRHGVLEFDGIKHRGQVEGLAFSAERSIFVSGSIDRTIQVWQTDPWKLVNIIDSHSSIRSIVFVSKNDLVFSSFDSLFHLVSVDSRDLLGDKPLPRFNGDSITSISFSVRHKMLAMGSRDGTVWLLDWENRSLLNKTLTCRGEIADVTFSPEGSMLAVVTYDGSICTWLFQQ